MVQQKNVAGVLSASLSSYKTVLCAWGGGISRPIAVEVLAGPPASNPSEEAFQASTHKDHTSVFQRVPGISLGACFR
eukprot:1630338-Amphidinium_carterae.1